MRSAKPNPQTPPEEELQGGAGCHPGERQRLQEERLRGSLIE
jgi:hypothetical protein